VPGKSGNVMYWYRIELEYHRPTFRTWDGNSVVKACFEEKYATPRSRWCRPAANRA
jgi:hypothetical protein